MVAERSHASRPQRRRRVRRDVSGIRRPSARFFVVAALAMAFLGTLPSVASASSCGHVVFHYRAGGRYHAIFAGLDYHSGIYARRFRCRDAQHFVRDYARAGFSGATYRTDFFPPDQSMASIAIASATATTQAATTVSVGAPVCSSPTPTGYSADPESAADRAPRPTPRGTVCREHLAFDS